MKSESYELQVISEENNLAEVLFFVKQCLGDAGYAPKTQRQVATAAEEVFVNIAHYAFGSETGSVSVHMEITDDPAAVTLIFMDSGIPFDPLKEQDPDVTLPGEDRDPVFCSDRRNGSGGQKSD